MIPVPFSSEFSRSGGNEDKVRLRNLFFWEKYNRFRKKICFEKKEAYQCGK